MNMLKPCSMGSVGESSIPINQPNQIIEDPNIDGPPDMVEISATEKLCRRLKLEDWEGAKEKDRLFRLMISEREKVAIRIQEDQLLLAWVKDQRRAMKKCEIEREIESINLAKERLRLVAVFELLVISDQSHSSEMISIGTISVRRIKISNDNILNLQDFSSLNFLKHQIFQAHGLYKSHTSHLQGGTEQHKLLQCNLLQFKTELLKLNYLLQFIALILTAMIPLFFWLQVQFLLKWYSIDHIRCILNACARFIHHDECWGYTSAGEWLRLHE